ncbi:MAG: C-type lectin domain-containing protein [Sandaracinaceae bacterium]
MGGPEECDDANLSNVDTCTNACLDAACGDGYLQPLGANGATGGGDDEECDDANIDGTATDTIEDGFCSDTCQQMCDPTPGTGGDTLGDTVADVVFTEAMEFNGHCYVFTQGVAPYELEGQAAADSRCVALSTAEAGGAITPPPTTAHLVTIDDAFENNFVRDTANTHGLGQVWIGLTDAVTEGTYVWYDNSAFTFSNWATAATHPSGQEQPDQANGSGTAVNVAVDCVVMSTDLADGWYGQWEDDTCLGRSATDRPGFVCEYVWPTP